MVFWDSVSELTIDVRVSEIFLFIEKGACVRYIKYVSLTAFVRFGMFAKSSNK